MRGWGYSQDSERDATVGALRDLEEAEAPVVETVAVAVEGRLSDWVGDIEISTAEQGFESSGRPRRASGTT